MMTQTMPHLHLNIFGLFTKMSSQVSKSPVRKLFIGLLLMLTVDFQTVLTFNVDTRYPLIFKGPKGSYFGYSVAILENSQATWLLAGAPRANDSSLRGVVEPGAVFQCNWQYRSSCQPVYIDDIGNEKQVIQKWRNITVRHKKDHQWLGAAIDINVHGKGQVMICAPRWTDTKFTVQSILLMNGICYESNKELSFNESSPVPALEYWKKQIHKDGYFIYGLGTLGMSVAYTKDGQSAILGAPGLNDWSGGFAVTQTESSSKPKVHGLERDEHHSSHFGMSVTSAKLTFEGVASIVGGPIADGYGKVFGYDKHFKLVLIKEGDQLGSRFGASVCAVDLNGDGFDDLLVGAPFYSDKMDEGRVYVFINKEFYNLELMDELLAGSNSPGARFGTAIANVGDLNLDKFEDVAVGAPFEEDSGVVYIYNGAKHGLRTEPAQRIVGRDLSSELKTFGWSFSRPWDVDNNYHQDIAVGAFQSDRVVLLRTRTVLDLYASLEITPQVINLKKDPTCMYQGRPTYCFEANICLHYRGRNIPPSSDVNITLTLDTIERHRYERSRLFILGSDDREITTINEIITLRLERLMCGKVYTVYIRKCRDVITPLELQLDFDIASSSIGIASSCTICPIRNKYNIRTLKEQARFGVDCKDLDCRPLLSLEARPAFEDSDKVFVIDNSPSFDVDITVHNSGEPSYITLVYIEHPSTIYFSSVTTRHGWSTVHCRMDLSVSNSSQTMVVCDMMAPIRSREQVAFTIKFFSDRIPYDATSLPITISVKPVGTEQPINKMNLTIPVLMKTKLAFTAVSVPLQLSMPHSSQQHKPNSDWASFSQLYILRNHGPSPLHRGQLTVTLPHLDWLRIDNVESESTSVADSNSYIPVVCSVSSQQNSLSHSGKDMKEENIWELKNKKTLVEVACASKQCSTVKCNISYMHKYERVYIYIKLAVPMNVLTNIKEKGAQQLSITSYGTFEGPVSYHSLTVDQNITTSTVFTEENPPHQGVTWWLLIISISSGLLLFYLITVILWKIGFFRRKKREELQRLIRCTESERELLHSDSASTGTSDVMVLPPSHSFSTSNGHGGMNNDRSLLHYPSEMDEATWEHAFQQADFFHNQSLNRRDIRQGSGHRSPAHWHNFNTIHSNSRVHVRHNNMPPTNRENLWVAPPAAAPVQHPSFNNEMYLEPLETRA